MPFDGIRVSFWRNPEKSSMSEDFGDYEMSSQCKQDGRPANEPVHVEVSPRIVRLVRSPIMLVWGGLTGVTFSFGLWWLHEAGTQGVPFSDFRVIGTAALIWLEGFFPVILAGPVVRQLGK